MRLIALTLMPPDRTAWIGNASILMQSYDKTFFMKTKQETQQAALQWAKEIKTQHPQAETLSIHFDGSGDSGDIQYIYVIDANCKSVTIEDTTDFLYDLIEHHVDVDWVNNDGGGGSIEIDLNNFTMNVSSFYREVIEAGHEMVELNLTDSIPTSFII